MNPKKLNPPRAFLHIGYHKTATTSLQDHFFTTLDHIKFIGKCSAWQTGSRQLHSNIISTVCNMSETKYTDRTTTLRSQITEYSAGKDIILSDELILGDSLDFMGGSTPLKVRIRRLNELFHEFEIHFIITCRYQPDAIHSLYTQKYPYLQKELRNFDNFISKPEISGLYDYTSIASTLESAKPKSITFIDFHDIINGDGVSSIRSLIEKTTKTTTLLPNTNAKKTIGNTKITPKASLRNLLHKTIPRHLFEAVKSNKTLFNAILPIWRSISEISFGNAKIQPLSKEESRKIHDIFLVSNRRFKEISHIDYTQEKA